LPLFANLTPSELAHLRKSLEEGRAAAGSVLVQEGQGAQTPLYVLLRGRANLTKRCADGRHHRLSELVAPAIFGEIDVLAGRPPLLSVRATTEVFFVTLAAEEITELCAQGDPGILKILTNLSTALRYRRVAVEAQLRQTSRPNPAARLGPLHRMLYAGWSPRRCG
jgi:CRP-like cAMP-binding protein